MDIRKVKSANGVIIIRAEEQSGEEDIRRIELESRAEPRPEFHEAMGGLISPAMTMIEAPGAWLTAATISGVSITHEDEGGIGAVVTILVPLECAPSPLVINTPYLTSVDNGSGAPRLLLPPALQQAVERVIDEAERYLGGDRAQGDLFAGRPEHVPVDNFAERPVVEADDVVEARAAFERINASAAETEPQVDGPILDRPPAEVAAEFDRLRAEAIRKQPTIKPARGRRAAKELT